MKFINRSRHSGKTTMLISTAHITGYPILVEDTSRATYIVEQARKMGINDIQVYDVDSYLKAKIVRHSIDGILIDEGEKIIEKALNNYLQSTVVACTFSIPCENIPENYD